MNELEGLARYPSPRNRSTHPPMTALSEPHPQPRRATRALLALALLAAAALLLGQAARARASGELGFAAVRLASRPHVVAVSCASAENCLALATAGPTLIF